MQIFLLLLVVNRVEFVLCLLYKMMWVTNILQQL